MVVEPHRPQAAVAVCRRGVGTGACPPVSTVITLSSTVGCLVVEAVVDPGDGQPVDQPLGVEEADGQLVVVARGAEGGGDQVAVEADLERLLDRDLVGHPPQAAVDVAVDEELVGSGPGHPSSLADGRRAASTVWRRRQATATGPTARG